MALRAVYYWVKAKVTSGERDVPVATFPRPETTYRFGTYGDQIMTTTKHSFPSSQGQEGQTTVYTRNSGYAAGEDFPVGDGYAGSCASHASVCKIDPTVQEPCSVRGH